MSAWPGALGGDLTVESVHSQGSTFTVRLPAVGKEPETALTRWGGVLLT